MKRFIISFMAFLFSICMFVPMAAFAADDDYTNGDCMQAIYDAEANIGGQISDVSDKIDGIEKGASQESVDELKESVDNIDVKQGVDDYFTEISGETSDEAKGYGESFADSVIGILNQVWAKVPEILTGNQESEIWNVTLDPSKEYNDTFYSIFVTIGYSLVLVFFAANLIETTIKYEIFTLKGGVQIFGRLIVSKVIIDLSGKICIYILNICNYISKDVLDTASTIVKFKMPTITGDTISKIPFVGGIIDFFQGYTLMFPVMIIVILMLFASLIIIIKLSLRSIELSLLMIVSPAFFACYSSEITKPYFKNFIVTFLQCALQIVFMAVVYALSSSFIIDFEKDYGQIEVWNWFFKTLPAAVIAIAIAIMMVRPPKVLTSLVR